jgi:hypothetical protein
MQMLKMLDELPELPTIVCASTTLVRHYTTHSMPTNNNDQHRLSSQNKNTTQNASYLTIGNLGNRIVFAKSGPRFDDAHQRLRAGGERLFGVDECARQFAFASLSLSTIHIIARFYDIVHIISNRREDDDVDDDLPLPSECIDAVSELAGVRLSSNATI